MSSTSWLSPLPFFPAPPSPNVRYVEGGTAVRTTRKAAGGGGDQLLDLKMVLGVGFHCLPLAPATLAGVAVKVTAPFIYIIFSLALCRPCIQELPGQGELVEISGHIAQS